MAFYYKERLNVVLGTNERTLLAAIRDDLITCNDGSYGWFLHDDQILASDYFVVRCQSSEGPSNNFYVKIRYWTGLGYIVMETTDSWNATTHTPGTNFVQGGYTQFSDGTYTTTSTTSYRISASEDHFIMTFNGNSGSLAYPPFYIGLFDKAFPSIDTQKKSCITLCYYQVSGYGTWWNDGHRIPVLYGADGTYNQRMISMHELAHKRAYNSDQFLGAGPWNGDGSIFSWRIPLWEDGGWGFRGYLKGVREVSHAASVTLSNWDVVNVRGKSYYWWRVRDDYGDDTISYRCPWNNYWTSSGTWKVGYLIPMEAV